jgi:polyisoprenoid-binding protein YceI
MTWSLDAHHTAVTFSAKHLGVATVRGSFGQVTAALELDDPNDPTTGSGTVTIQAASVSTNSEQRDGHLKGADFFDEHSGSVVDPFGNTKVGGTLSGTINRSDWGLTWNVPLGGGGFLVGEKVKLEIDGELGQDKPAEAEPAAEGAATGATA